MAQGMLVVHEEADVQGGSACGGLDGIHQGFDGSSDGVWAKAETLVND